MSTRRYEKWPLIKEHRGWFGGVVDRFRTRSRRVRAEMFLDMFELSASTRVLDLGGGNGTHIHAVLEGSPVAPANTYIADIDAAAMKDGADRYGYTPVVISETGRLPFSDGFFDIVFCSSVIEHVTVPKETIWSLTSGSRFRSIARQRQRAFAEEIRRMGNGYFVQVPYRWFPIETHTWLPFFSYLPRCAQIPLMRATYRFWIKKSIPDFHLPSELEMRNYFPDARILREKLFGVTKALIAYKQTNSMPFSNVASPLTASRGYAAPSARTRSWSRFRASGAGFSPPVVPGGW
jgi:SAM-dependent methyltransferase